LALKPHRIRYWLTPKPDPNFDTKRTDTRATHAARIDGFRRRPREERRRQVPEHHRALTFSGPARFAQVQS